MMHRNPLQIPILVALVACIHGVVNVEGSDHVKNLEKSSKNTVLNGDNNLRDNSKTEAKYDVNDAEDEERWNFPSLSKFTSIFKKPGVAKVLKENPVLAKTLSNNPALVKSIEKTPQFSKTLQTMQKDPKVMGKINSFQKTPAASKLKTMLGSNPKGLTEKFVTKLGAFFYNSNGVVAAIGVPITMAILITLGLLVLMAIVVPAVIPVT